MKSHAETTADAHAAYVRAARAYAPPPASTPVPKPALGAPTFRYEMTEKVCFYTRVDKITGEEKKSRRVIVRVFVIVETPTLTGGVATAVYKFYEHRGEFRVMVPGVGEHGRDETMLADDFRPRAVKMWGAERAARVFRDAELRVR